MISIDSENHLASVVSHDKKNYCTALENSGIYSACNENLKSLLELLEPFFDLLNKTFWLSEPGNFYFLPKTPLEKTLLTGLFQMNLVSCEGRTHFSLTKKGYDLIHLYRKKKKLPTRKQERQIITNKIIDYSDKLKW